MLMRELMRNMSMKAKLSTVLTGIIVMVLVTLVAARFMQMSESLEGELEQRLRHHAYLADGIFNTTTSYTEKMLATAAEMPQVRTALAGGNPDEAADVFATIRNNMSYTTADGVSTYEELMLFDADMNLVTASGSVAFTNASELGHDENIRRAQQGQSWISDVSNCPVSGQTQMLFSHPVIIDGSFQGMVATFVNTQTFGIFLQRVIEEFPGSISFADATGAFFFSNNPNYIGRFVPEAGIAEAHGRIPINELFYHTSGITGFDKVAYITVGELTGWIIVSFFDTDEIDNILLVIVLSLIPTVAGLLIGVFVLMGVIYVSLRPLEGLAEMAAEVAKGNTNIEFNIKNNDEIGRVSRAFLGIVESLDILEEGFKRGLSAYKHGDIIYRMEDSRLEGAFANVLKRANDISDEFLYSFEELSEPFIYVDEECKIYYANKRIKELTRTVGRDVVGMHLNELLNGNVSGHPRIVKAYSEGTPQTIQDIQLQLNPEQLLNFQMGITPFFVDEKVACLMIFMVDTTEIIEMQAHTEKLNAYRNERTAKLTDTIVGAFEQGNLAISITKSDFDQDTKEIAKEQDAVEAIVQKATGTIKSYVDEITAVLHAFSENTFDARINRQYIGDFGSIRDSIGMITESIGALVREIQAASSQVETGTGQISQSTQELMLGFDQQNSVLSEVREAINTLTETTQKNAKAAKSANDLSLQVQEAASSGRKNMSFLTEAMDEIKESSAEISKVVAIIENIAFQTNLLALNASVEAARAGEHGKGFSVVAEEVRNLAGRSDEAAKDASEMLTKSLTSVEAGASRTEQTSEVLGNIADFTANVAEAIANISQSSSDQTDEISRIQASVDSLYNSASGNSDIVQSNASVSRELSSQASQLRTLIERFKV